jgi:hypothetical protein
MSSKLSLQELKELKSYVKKKAKQIKAEGSTTAGVPGYQTPAAFTGDEGGEGGTKTNLEQGQFAYSIKAPKKKKHFIKLHEISYKMFKEDNTTSEIQKVNRKILEVNKMLREISRALDHSIKLKQESSLDNSKYWKRTNEAILKINKRLSEVSKKARKLANLKEIEGNAIKTKLESILQKAGISYDSIESSAAGGGVFNLDVYIHGEPYPIDYEKGTLTYQSPDRGIELGALENEEQIITNLKNILKP